MTNETPNPDEKPPENPNPSDPWARQPTPAPASSEPAVTPASTQSPAPPPTVPPPPGVQSAPEAVAIGEPVVPSAAPAAPAKRSPAIPTWLPMVGLAIVPAVIVGLVVYFVFGGGGGSNTTAARIVDGLVRLNGSEGMTTYEGKLPPDFADDFPIYGDVVVAIAISSVEGTSYFVVLESDDDASKVYDFYSRELDKGPWQVEFGSSGDEVSGVSFLRPDNPDITGQVSIFRSSVDGKTALYVSMEDISQTSMPGSRDNKPFVLGASRPLPPGFPNDIPIYKASEGTVVIETGFQRGQGAQLFLVTFLTRDGQDDVIDFYTAEFKKRGWNVNEGVLDTNFSLGIEFDDGPSQGISGSVNADSFEEDDDYTRVDLFLQVSPTRRN